MNLSLMIKQLIGSVEGSNASIDATVNTICWIRVVLSHVSYPVTLSSVGTMQVCTFWMTAEVSRHGNYFSNWRKD
jgi:hypothetical protein